jgi:hypothetical protein
MLKLDQLLKRKPANNAISESRNGPNLTKGLLKVTMFCVSKPRNKGVKPD